MKTTMSQGETVSHTPGPWTWSRGSVTVHAGKNKVIDACYFNKPVPEAEANARLIAAAPDLLSACSRAYYSLCKVAGTESEYRVMAPELLIESLKSALAKAGATTTQKEGAK